MKTKLIGFLFIFTAFVLGAAFYYTKKFTVKEETSVTRAKVIPAKASDSASDTEEENHLSSIPAETFDTFVELLPTETLISSLTLDFNDDSFDDEVIIVRKSGVHHFVIIPALYNEKTEVYERLSEIPTNISRTRTFSYSGLDLTGDHKTSLIYQGTDDDGRYVMKVFLFKEQNGVKDLVCIGDFSSDGTIFIQQTERSESYALSIAKGESFSIWVYKSEKDEQNSKNANLNQIQEEYKWNPDSQCYELENTVKVSASRLAAKELSRIQDGTVETFADFLNGLWYKTTNTGSSIRYIYFDYNSREVILVNNENQEVYEWEDSKLRHNGIYLTTVNSSITNLHRRFDVALVNVDEIRISIRDEINLLIKETNMWDGSYKKLSLQSSLDTNTNDYKTNEYQQELEKEPSTWTSADAFSSISFKDSCYTLKTSNYEETGIYSFMKIGSYNVIQVRSNTTESQLNQTYALEFGTKTITEVVNAKKKITQEKVVTDYDTVTFTPVKITPTDCFSTEGRLYTFVRNQE
ncbi:MAG: pallilysin-related adhesin [Treponema sp.]|nr:pallilysin-related adhesin [Treponema sp.]